MISKSKPASQVASPLGFVVALGAGLVYGAYGGMGAAYATGAGLSMLEVARSS